MVESFTTSLGTFYHGDAREVLKRLPSSSVDVVLTDPPWGVGFDEHDNLNAFLEVVPELYRVLKRNSWLVFFFTPKRIYELTPLLKYFRYVWMIPYVFWAFGTHSRNPLGSQASYSVIMVFAKGEPKIKVARKDVIISDELPFVVENIKEPQFKPTYTVSVLLTMFTREGDLVLDPFAGYGSIPLVCEFFNRRWVAVEIDPVKYEIARRIVTEKRVYNIAKLKKTLSEKKLKGDLSKYLAVGSPTSSEAGRGLDSL